MPDDLCDNIKYFVSIEKSKVVLVIFDFKYGYTIVDLDIARRLFCSGKSAQPINLSFD
jgi:hypothetical protein